MPAGFPGAGPNMASPEMNSGPPTPERNTLLASPLADRLGGGLQQQHGKLAMMVNIARKLLQAIAVLLNQSDPKAAAEIETFSAKLLRIGATANVGPAQIPGMAAQLPAMPSPGMPLPPPVGGTGGLANPLMGMMGGGMMGGR